MPRVRDICKVLLVTSSMKRAFAVGSDGAARLGGTDGLSKLTGPGGIEAEQFVPHHLRLEYRVAFVKPAITNGPIHHAAFVALSHTEYLT